MRIGHTGTPARYRLGGLLVESNVPLELRLPEVRGGDPDIRLTAVEEQDIFEFLADRPEVVFEVAQAGKPWLEVYRGSGAYLTRWTGVLDILVPDSGTSMLASRRAELIGLDPARVLCQALSFVLDAHGREGLHATTVELDGAAVALAGSSGRGKAVLAHALCAMGGRPFAVDLSVLRLDDSGRPLVEPGITEFRDRGTFNGSDSHAPTGDGRFAAAGALPLRALYVLGWTAGQPMVSVPLRGSESLAAFFGSVFNMVVASPRRLGVQFQIGTATAEHARVERVSWRPGPENARVLAERIVHELAGERFDPAFRSGKVHAAIPAGGLTGPGADSWRDREGARREIVALLREAGAGEEVENGMDEPLLRTSQVAALLRSSDRTVRSWADAGKLKFVKTLGGRRLFPASAVLSALRAMTGVAKEEED